MPSRTLALSLTFHTLRPQLIRRLSRAFPNACVGRVEDAVHEAFADALADCAQPESSVSRALSTGRLSDIKNVLYTYAWRGLRGEFRSLRHRSECVTDQLPEGPHSSVDPLSVLEAARMSRRLKRLIPTAARQTSKKRAVQLTAALEDRLHSGDTDKLVAARHGLERTMLCRARNLLRVLLVTG